MDFEVNSDINCKVSLYQGEITKINFDALVNEGEEVLMKLFMKLQGQGC